MLKTIWAHIYRLNYASIDREGIRKGFFDAVSSSSNENDNKNNNQCIYIYLCVCVCMCKKYV